MKRLLNTTLALSIALTVGACSSSKPKNGVDDSANTPPAADAGTDAVPQASAEGADSGTPPPPADANSGGDASGGATADNGGAPAAPADNSPPVQMSGQFDSYTVQAGDTLMKIAFENYGDLYKWKSILEANKEKVTDPNKIPAGTVLKVEKPSTPVAVERNGDKYLIKMGDTLGTISNDIYGTKKKWKKLWENNKQMIHDPNRIFAGFFLYYSITPEEKQQAEQLKQQQPTTVNPQPLANSGSAPAQPQAPADDGNARAPASLPPMNGDGATPAGQ